MLDNLLERCSDILVDFQARHKLSRAAFAVFVVLILIGIPEIIEVHAKLPNNIATVVSPLGAFKENSDFKNVSRQITNAVQLGNKTVNLSNTTDASNPQICVVAKNVYTIWENRGMGMSIVLFKRSIDNGATFGHAIRLSNSTDYSTHPEISASGNILYVLWQRYNSDILLRKSTDNGATFGPVVKVTDITGNAQDLQLATSGDDLYVLWKDAASGDILLKKSTNGGVGFGSILKLTDDASSVLNPRMYAYGTTLYIIWTKDDGAEGRSIMFLKTAITNKTSILSPPIKLTNSTEEPSSSSSARIASWGKNVFVLWEDDAIQHKSMILLKQSIDSGTTFGPALDLSEKNTRDFDISFNPEIATVDNNLYIKFQDILSGILLKKSADAGISFGPAIILSNSTAVSHLNIAAAENGFVYVLWENTYTGDNNIFFKRSIDNGATFGPAIELSNNNAGQPLSHPLLSAWKNDVYVLWQDLSTGNYSILLKKSTDNGATFGPVVKVTDITGNAQDLQLATSGDNLYVLWKDAASGDILLKKSTNGGVGFGPATKLGASTLPDANIATAGTNVYVVWKDIVSGNYNILFKRSIDNGATFGPAISIIKNGTTAISNLNIATVGTSVYVGWKDIVSGNYNILFKRSIDNGATFGPAVDLSKEGFDPHISISTGGVYVVWQDVNSQGTGGISIIRSTDHGTTFGPAISIIKNGTTAISNLNIATVGTSVYVGWKASSMILKRSTDNGTTFGPAVDLSKYYEGLVNFNGVTDLQLVTSQENNNVYLGWNQPILSPADNSSSLHSDVVFARVQPALFVQSSLYYKEQLLAPAKPTPARGSGERLLSLMRPQPQVEEGVWFYANYWKGPLTNLIVDELAKRKINTIYFSAPNNAGWDNSSKVFNYVDFINYARAKGMRVLGVTLEDPSFVFSTEPELKKTFGDFIKQTTNIFDGYVIDVEPQAVPGADIHVYLPRYIQMSKILRNVADEYHREFIDSVPAWYHTVLKQIGISIGVNALSSNRINLIDYTYPTTEAILNNINDIRSEISTPYIVNLMITPGHGAPQLSGQEIPRTVITLKSNLLPIAFDEAQYLLNLDSGLFP